MKLLIGSTNRGKFIEITEALKDLPVHLLAPADLAMNAMPREEGDTFEANAQQKAVFYHQQSNLPTLADDSGIIVEALANELGIHTRRWGAGPEASDQRWIAFFLDRMRTEKNKRARFVCVLCLIDQGGQKHFFTGSCEGVITNELEADYLPGLPISACFKPDGYEKVFSALSIEEKHAVSHRGKALSNFKNYFQNLIEPHI